MRYITYFSLNLRLICKHNTMTTHQERVDKHDIMKVTLLRIILKSIVRWLSILNSISFTMSSTERKQLA